MWFVIAAVALVLGLLLLRADQRAGGAQSRDRGRWAAEKEWEYLDSDPVLPSRWRYGTIHQGGPGVARNLVTGSVPTPEGRRLIYVFDHEQAGRLTSVVVAVQRRNTLGGAFELRLPSAPLPDDAGLDLLEPVGQRYAFVTDAAVVRPLLTPRLVRAADAVGDDIELLWAEESWVLCTAPLDYEPEQLQELLDQLVEVAGALEEASRGGQGALPAGPTSLSGSSAATWARTLSGRTGATATLGNMDRSGEVTEPVRGASDSGQPAEDLEGEPAEEPDAEGEQPETYWAERGQASAGRARGNRLAAVRSSGRPRPSPGPSATRPGPDTADPRSEPGAEAQSEPGGAPEDEAPPSEEAGEQPKPAVVRPIRTEGGLSPQERSAASRAAAERAAAERAAAERAALDRAATSKAAAEKAAAEKNQPEGDDLDIIGFGKGAGNGSGPR